MKWFVAMLVVAGLGLAGWAIWPEPIAVDTASVSIRPLQVTVSDDGITRIRDIFTVSAPVGGRLTRASLEDGDAVVADKTVIAQILPGEPVFLDARTRREAEAAAAAAQAGVNLADVMLLQAEAQHNFALSDLRRAQTLLARKAISERELEAKELDVVRAEAEVGSARATANMRRQDLASANARLIQPGADRGADSASACCVTVHAPTDGVVVNVVIESEQVVAAGAPIIEMGDPDDIEVAVELLSREAVRVKAGDHAFLDGWGGDDTVLEATVRRVEPAARTEISALGIEEQRVEVLLDLAGGASEGTGLGHNYRVVAHIVVWEDPEALTVPLGALFRQDDAWAVFVVEDGRARLALVEIGQRNSRFAQVLSGLSDGAVVVVHPSDTVMDGTRVEERQVERAT